MFAALVPWSRMFEKQSNLNGTILSPIGQAYEHYEIHLHFSRDHGGKKIAPVD